MNICIIRLLYTVSNHVHFNSNPENLLCTFAISEKKKLPIDVISLPILFCFHFVLVGSESSPISWLPSFLLYCMHHGVGHDIGWRQRRLTSVDKSQAVIVVAPLRIPFCLLLSFLPSNCFSEFLLYPILSQFLYSSCMVSIHENTLFWKTQHLSSRAITNICQWLCSSLPSLLRSPFTTTATICKKRKQKYGINMMQGNAQWCINAVLGSEVFPNTCLFGVKIQISIAMPQCLKISKNKSHFFFRCLDGQWAF